MLEPPNVDSFRKRYWPEDGPQPDDVGDEYGRDRARIVHSASFRRLQAKTQVMGVDEGDFHRTRLTHSIEAAQIGEQILSALQSRYKDDAEKTKWLPDRDLVLAACYAHDLGHPPFGHGGERSLHSHMVTSGGFEGNGQTLRILTRLEKYSIRRGINPTRRLILAVLKYPVPYSQFDSSKHLEKPPKCYLDTEQEIVDWALGSPFTDTERRVFTTTLKDGKPKHRSLDCSLMECADDVAYAVSDLEDIFARRLVQMDGVLQELEGFFKQFRERIGDSNLKLDHFKLLDGYGSHERKYFCGKLINLFIDNARIEFDEMFEHPLLRFSVAFPSEFRELLRTLKQAAYHLVVKQAPVQQLERRGQRIVGLLYQALIVDPKCVIPTGAWTSLGSEDSEARKVCDYIAGMTDPYAEKIYRRLYVPGFGSSTDEL
jgi:dGTPase